MRGISATTGTGTGTATRAAERPVTVRSRGDEIFTTTGCTEAVRTNTGVTNRTRATGRRTTTGNRCASPVHTHTHTHTHTRDDLHLSSRTHYYLLTDLKDWSFVFIPLITYGFWGMELLSVELSDPFGEDANDLDIQGAVDDCFSTIADMFDLPKPKSFEDDVIMEEAATELTKLSSGGAPSLYQLI